MAKQVGPLFFTGTIDGLIFYKLGDNYYTRSKGSYKSAKHMRRNPRYQRTMEKADQFGRASRLLKEVYYCYLPKAIRKHGLYGKLTGVVNTWLQQGKSPEEVRALLLAHLQQLAAAVGKTPAKANEKAVKPTINQHRTTNNAQPSPPAPNAQRTTNNEQRSTNTAQRPTRSCWKVKPNGRLQMPGSLKRLPIATSLKCHTKHNPKLTEEVNIHAPADST